MRIDLPISPELEQLLREQLAKGRYQDAGDLVATALRQLQERSPPQNLPPDFAFGLWQGRTPDGLTYERALRAEWGQ
jgi:hypothetical protein